MYFQILTLGQVVWIDIADTQSDTSTEHVINDINIAGDNSESEAEGYETDSEDNDIHSESRAAAWEDYL